jgi:hypothetical protein
MKEIKKVLHIGIIITMAILMCFQAGAISNINPNEKIIKPTAMTNLADMLISVDNPDGDDIHPRLALGPEGMMVCTYEKQLGLFSSLVPVTWSADGGETWTTQFEFDSLDFTEGTGFLQYPDIHYNAVHDVYFLTMVDPFAEIYNNEMSFVPGDIANAESASWYGISGGGSENYFYASGASTDNFFISLTTEDGYGFVSLFGLGYFTYPDFEGPPGMGGFYYDGNSEHLSAPGYELEMDSGDQRIFITCETRLDGEDPQITIKSTVSDEDVLTSGEQQNGMDKYADIEQYPGEYVAYGTDPDVSSSGLDVCIVYVDGGSVKCAYSSFSAPDYDPNFSWQFSTIDSGSAPSVYMSGSTVQCAYVKNGNVYKAVSTDKGASWDTPQQINQVDGTVVDEPGSVDITDIGLVWTDDRDGQKDIYTAGAADIPIIEVATISGGFGVKAVVENTGTADGEDIPWSISFDGGVFVGAEKSGSVNIPMESSTTIKSGFILGIGATTITVQAGDSVKTATATVLGPFVIGL